MWTADTMIEEKSLEQTPTWAVALVCTVFVVASLLVERGLNKLGQVMMTSLSPSFPYTHPCS